MFKNKGKRKNQRIKILVVALSLVMGMFLWCDNSVYSLALGKAKVVANSGRIREKADKSSDTVGSVEKGNSLDVISQTTDADGYTWYKVYVNKEKTGYIRADLVTVEGTISTEDKKEETKTESTDEKPVSEEQAEEKKQESGGNKTVVGSNNSTTTEKTSETKTEEKTETKTETVVVAVNVTETDVASVKVTDSVRVRKGAGTNFDVVEVAPDGTVATVSGIAADSQGKNWYQVSFNTGNKTVNGFIREDLVEVAERIEPQVEEEVPEEAAPQAEENVVESEDYYLQYLPNDAGEMDWFLFDNIQGTKQSLSQLLEAVEQANTSEESKDEQGSTMRMIIIAMAVVVVVLIIVVTILIFKLRDTEYEYEDDDDEYDDDDADDDDHDNDDDDDEEEEVVEKKIKTPRIGFFKKKEVVEDTDEDDDDDEEEEIPVIKPQTPVKENNKSWQSKDFLELDDDMEFEFLDL